MDDPKCRRLKQAARRFEGEQELKDTVGDVCDTTVPEGRPVVTDGGHEERRLSAHEVYEGDEVFMGISLHGRADDYPDVEYDRELYQTGVEGTIIEAPDEGSVMRKMLHEGETPVTDFRLRADSGETFTWNVDNGYVISYHPGLDRVSDIGKISGFYRP